MKELKQPKLVSLWHISKMEQYEAIKNRVLDIFNDMEAFYNRMKRKSQIGLYNMIPYFYKRHIYTKILKI